MRNRIQMFLALALTALTVQGGCVIIPELKTKLVELVAAGSACDTLNAIGIINNHDDLSVIDLKTGIDIPSVLDDAGIDVDAVDSVAVFGVTYKTTQPDPDPAREIVNGTVTVQRGSYNAGTQVFTPSGAEIPIVQNFNVMVNSVTSDATAPLTAAGVALLNQILNDCLQEAKGGPLAANTAIRYHVTGVSNPQNVATDFKWRICVAVNMKGKVEVDVIE